MVEYNNITCEGEKYLTIQALEKFSCLYGEKGKLLTGIAKYFRWVDDIVDESDLSKEEKLKFLQCQEKLLTKRIDIETLRSYPSFRKRDKT
jgi:hypothetical protein